MSFDYKKTLKKVGTQTIIVVLAGLASVYGNNPLYLALVPALNGILNVVKHYND